MRYPDAFLAIGTLSRRETTVLHSNLLMSDENATRPVNVDGVIIMSSNYLICDVCEQLDMPARYQDDSTVAGSVFTSRLVDCDRRLISYWRINNIVRDDISK